MIGQLIVNGLVFGAIIALMAVGFSLIFGILRIVNFWHGEAYMLGAVSVYFLVVRAGVPYGLALLIATAIVGGIGWVSDRFVFYRFHGNLMGGAIATVAFSLGMQNSMWYILGPIPRGIPSLFTGTLEVLGIIVSLERIFVVAVSITVILLLAWLIKSTKLGKTMRAVQQDSEAAITLGISSKRVCAITFGMATALAALGGGLIGPTLSVAPTIGLQPLIFALLTVILGGLGSIYGALIASIIIGLTHSFSSAFLGPQFSLAISFGLAIAVLTIRPRGLMGHD